MELLRIGLVTNSECHCGTHGIVDLKHSFHPAHRHPHFLPANCGKTTTRSLTSLGRHLALDDVAAVADLAEMLTERRLQGAGDNRQVSWNGGHSLRGKYTSCATWQRASAAS